MTRTVDEGFREFLRRLTPSGSESASASSHRVSLEACLKANFGLNRFFRIGSFGNGTSVSGFSDVDYLASLPTSALKENSSTTLRIVREALENRFPASGVQVDCPAVKVPFGTNGIEATEIVPADFIERKRDCSLYEIADCSGGWMRASPEAHNGYVASVNAKLGNKVKPLIRFIKAWKFYRNVPITSFYLELRTAKYAESQSSIFYDIDLRLLLSNLLQNDLARMQDPMGISGYISPCKSEAQHADALSKLQTAVTRAVNAREAEKAGDTAGAFYWWNLLFDDAFPSYYHY